MGCKSVIKSFTKVNCITAKEAHVVQLLHITIAIYNYYSRELSLDLVNQPTYVAYCHN